MPLVLRSLTPNLVVSDVARSVAFYRDVLGFALGQTVPDAEPYVFAIVKSGAVEIYLNAPGPAADEYPSFVGRPIGGTLTLFIQVERIHQCYDELKDTVKVVMPLVTQWYGVTEFAFEDPDGYVLTFAEAGAK